MAEEQRTMNPIRTAETEAAIVKAVASCVTDVMEGEWGDRTWVHLFVDFEIDESGERSSSIAFALARLPGRTIEKVNFRISREVKQLFARLADGMGASPNGRWTCAQLRIEKDGRYATDYIYAPPRRLGGQLLDTRFTTYGEEWLGSDAGAAFRVRPRTVWQRVTGK